MKKKLKGVNKGAPSGFVISLMVHAGAFLLAGMLVVFTVHQKEEKKFVPPKPVDRPKMKLKKPKVKVKKSAKPKTSTRIVTKVRKASMPDIQLPEMGGMGGGLTDGIGGFDLMPDLEEITVFGNGQSIGNDLTGTFIDFKRDRRGRSIPADRENVREYLKDFVASGMRPSKLARFYRSPKKLYATTFAIGPNLSSVAPAAFGEEDTLGYLWAAHYTGQLVYHEDITFRFRGKGDDVLVVCVDGEIVLSACHSDNAGYIIAPYWQSDSADHRKYRLGNGNSAVGDWVTLKAGVPLKLDVLIGEDPGGIFCSLLAVEVKGVEYERNVQGGPILPIFKTEEPTRDLMEAIHKHLIDGEASVTNGPVFRDFPRGSRDLVAVNEVPVEPAPEVEEKSVSRIWALAGDRQLEAQYVTRIGDKVILKSSRGKQSKVPMADLSAEDREYIELSTPPEFKFSFAKKSATRHIESSPYNNRLPPRILDYVFSAKLEQTTAGDYNHELEVEFFAVGDEIDGDNYILLDRQIDRFTPTRENNRSFAFSGNKIALWDYEYAEQRRGEKYGGYLITVTDTRGEVIAYGASHEWLYEQLEKLKKLPLGKHFNKQCVRVGPPRPIRTY